MKKEKEREESGMGQGRSGRGGRGRGVKKRVMVSSTYKTATCSLDPH